MLLCPVTACRTPTWAGWSICQYCASSAGERCVSLYIVRLKTEDYLFSSLDAALLVILDSEWVILIQAGRRFHCCCWGIQEMAHLFQDCGHELLLLFFGGLLLSQLLPQQHGLLQHAGPVSLHSTATKALLVNGSSSFTCTYMDRSIVLLELKLLAFDSLLLLFPVWKKLDYCLGLPGCALRTSSY